MHSLIHPGSAIVINHIKGQAPLIVIIKDDRWLLFYTHIDKELYRCQILFNPIEFLMYRNKSEMNIN